jgi:hypothetical protein
VAANTALSSHDDGTAGPPARYDRRRGTGARVESEVHPTPRTQYNVHVRVVSAAAPSFHVPGMAYGSAGSDPGRLGLKASRILSIAESFTVGVIIAPLSTSSYPRDVDAKV